MKAQAFPFLILITFFFLLFFYTKTAGPIPFQVQSTTTQKTDTFTVRGEGISLAKPDIATISVGISANAATVSKAQEQINSVIAGISEAVKKLGIESKDIKTTNYNIHPNYDYQSGTQKITGYRASTSLSIKIRDIDKINDVIDLATANGANEVGNISFSVDDKTKAENEARQKAVAEAKKKAQEAANIAGFNLGKIINYSENFQDYPQPVYMGRDTITLEKGAPTQVEPGSSEIRVIVNLSYELR